MAVVKMNKFTIIGIDDAAEDLLTSLMEFGATELSSQDSKLVDEEWASLALKQRNDLKIAETESRLQTIDGVLKTLSSYDTSKKPIFSLRRDISKSLFEETIEGEKTIEEDVKIILDLSNHLKELQSARNKTETTVIGLEPWAEYQIPLEVQETKNTCITMGNVPPRLDISLMENAVAEITDLFVLDLISADQEQQYVSFIYAKEAEEAINAVMKQFGFNKVFFKDLTGNAAENITNLKSEIEGITKQIADVEKGFTDMLAHMGKIELLYDHLTITLDKMKALDKMISTNRAFYIDGWAPAAECENLASLFEQYGCHYEIIVPEKGEDTPVLLHNNAFITPIESITGLYDTPSSRDVDPTPVFALFYICFFGMMFADTGYGVLLATLSFVMVKSGKLEGGAYKFIKQLGYCGVSAAIWGVIFGSYFGNLIPVASELFLGRAIVIQPIWMDPVENALTMVIFSCIFGVFHLFVGLGVKAYKHIRDGSIADAINESFLWYLLISGLGLLLAGDVLFEGAANIGKWMAIAGAGGIVLLPVFIKKGAAKMVGLWNLYGITGYVADILSYARLLALCLAGSVIALVFNTLAAIAGGNSVIGAIIFIVIVVVAHVFNFLLSGLGAFVHAIRLQYVEFFGKFFEGKGEPFQPFMKNTKYVKIVKEEN